jgi:hypothetical protein
MRPLITRAETQQPLVTVAPPAAKLARSSLFFAMSGRRCVTDQRFDNNVVIRQPPVTALPGLALAFGGGTLAAGRGLKH